MVMTVGDWVGIGSLIVAILGVIPAYIAIGWTKDSKSDNQNEVER
jgi:hypothetical protein